MLLQMQRLRGPFIMSSQGENEMRCYRVCDCSGFQSTSKELRQQLNIHHLCKLAIRNHEEYYADQRKE